MDSKKLTIQLMSKNLEYTLTFKPVKNINMRIKKDGLFVSAPKGTSIPYIENVLKNRGNQIVKHINKISSYHTAEPFKEGRPLLFLGNNYTLHIIESTKNDVIVNKNSITLYTKNTDSAKNVYEAWMKRQANMVFSDSLERIYPLLMDHIPEKPHLHVKKLSASWGRCTPSKGSISLSVWLVKADIALIDYVVLHELCHYVHLDHSKKFYELLSSFMPDYKERRDLLNTIKTGP